MSFHTKEHISQEERLKWNKLIEDFENHLGNSGIEHHAMGNGVTPGFSTNDYTNDEKSKLEGIEVGALNNPHPETHPYTMITGLSTIAHTGRYPDLLDIPDTFIAGGGDSDTVGGIRITVGPTEPENAKNEKDVWFDTSTKLVKVYTADEWKSFNAVWA